jgi:hypothetical protein
LIGDRLELFAAKVAAVLDDHPEAACGAETLDRRRTKDRHTRPAKMLAAALLQLRGDGVGGL